MITTNILTGLFIGIMVSVFMISLFSTLSIKFLEGIGIYRKGSLTCGGEDYTSDEGFHKRGKVYRYRNEDGMTRFESARVFCALMLVAIPFSVGIVVLFYVLK